MPTTTTTSSPRIAPWRVWVRHNRRWLFVAFCVALGLGGVLGVVLLSEFFH
jgi:hypothetical protein